MTDYSGYSGQNGQPNYTIDNQGNFQFPSGPAQGDLSGDGNYVFNNGDWQPYDPNAPAPGAAFFDNLWADIGNAANGIVGTFESGVNQAGAAAGAAAGRTFANVVIVAGGIFGLYLILKNMDKKR